MAFSPTTPITGAAQTGFTSPTYTHQTDTAMTNYGKQVAVTALGGTQAGVTVHSAQSPFICAFYRPSSIKTIVTGPDGTVKSVPVNKFTYLTKKGATPGLGIPVGSVLIRTEITVPAGAEAYDAPNVRAALSAHVGLLNQQSAGIGDTIVSGLL